MSYLSLILPYFNRERATNASLARMAELYPDLDMEVIVVDDGSEDAYYAPPGMPWPVFVKRLPPKSDAKNPCLPINIGVFASSGHVIALSGPEMLHRAAILPQLVASLGGADYVAAACWCDEQKRWHAHSSRTPLFADKTDVQMPPNAQYHFLAVLSRGLWAQCEGFDNDYRNGAGYDDNDFLMRLARLGATFAVRDDLIVDHPRKGARAAWTPEMFSRNRELFLSKWRTH